MGNNTAILLFLAFVAAVVAAFTLEYIARYDFGLSRQEIRTPSVVAAGVIGLLLAIAHFGNRLRKP
jgi:hypothetical protein